MYNSEPNADSEDACVCEVKGHKEHCDSPQFSQNLKLLQYLFKNSLRLKECQLKVSM